MDSPAVGGDVFKEMCKRNLRGEEKGMARQQATGNRFGRACGQKARSNLRELPNTTFTVMIHWVSNRKDMVLAPKQLQASYTDVRHWEELVDFINKNGGPKDPYIFK